MKHNSERSPEHGSARLPLTLMEGRKILRRSAKKAGVTASRVATQGRRIFDRTVNRTERYARRNPWTGLGAAACTGACIGALLTFLFVRD